MSITQAMYAGASALSNMSEAITVIGNNLSNSNTIAFKSSSASFQDVLIQTVGNGGGAAGSTTQVGTGMGLAGVTQDMTQGSFAPSASVTDMSINGNGFFKVRDPTGAIGSDPGASGEDMFYTRAGNFTQDSKGHLVNPGGLILQGYKIDDQGNTNLTGTSDITLPGPNDMLSPQATTKVVVNANLDPSVQIFSNPPPTINPNDPSTYSFSTSVRVFDSFGVGHNMSIQFQRVSETNWNWQAAVQKNDLDPAQGGVDRDTSLIALPSDPNVPSPTGATYTAGVLQFDSNGRLAEEGSTPLLVQFAGGANPQDILIDFGQATDPMGDSTNDFSKKQTTDLKYDPTLVTTAKSDVVTSAIGSTTSVSGGFATTKLDQDGYTTGNISKISIDATGVITGSYTNSQSKRLYRVGLVNFADQGNLSQKGGNLFAETSASGQPLPGTPKDGGFGSVVSNSLEQSNVDLSGQFVQMIATQRGFQANSRVVTVVDSMLEELLSLKR